MHEKYLCVLCELCGNNNPNQNVSRETLTFSPHKTGFLRLCFSGMPWRCKTAAARNPFSEVSRETIIISPKSYV